MTSLQRSLCFFATISTCQAQKSRLVGWNDRYTYQDASIYRADGFVDWAPHEWHEITCNEGKQLDQCLAYIDKWDVGRNWKITRNYCQWCPQGSDECGRHHQSPIDLMRETGYPLDHGNELANECIDLHWIKYEDSFCTFDQLRERDAFTIERHALRTAYPIYITENAAEARNGDIDDGWVVSTENTVHLDCPIEGRGPRFPRMDYSKGFSDWFYLSHVDIHVPSEHTQNGIRFDAEVQMQHFYTLPVGILNEKNQANENEMGTVSVFLQSFDDAPPNLHLDMLICEWRRKEREVIQQCPQTTAILNPIPDYPGCDDAANMRRNLRRGSQSTNHSETHKHDFQTVHEVLLHNSFYRASRNHTEVKIGMNPSNFEAAETKDWENFILAQSRRMKAENALYKDLMNGRFDSRTAGSYGVHKQFSATVDVPWSDYWAMLGCKTEYYFRYQGSGTIPPCYGENEYGKRTGVNHWRVMKDPAQINPIQLAELQRLIAERIAPSNDPIAPCQRDTAAKIDPQGGVSTARPLQQFNENGHKMTFCECKDWESKWEEDRQWCAIQDINERFFDKRFNWEV
jgi:carbonic anhydrase